MKLKSYRNEEIRFGPAEHKEPINSEVTTWYMTPEQLEEYRNRPKREQIKITKPIKLPMGKKKHGAIR